METGLSSQIGKPGNFIHYKLDVMVFPFRRTGFFESRIQVRSWRLVDIFLLLVSDQLSCALAVIVF